MIPQRLVDAQRQHVDVSVGIYGIDCVLKVPSNLNTVETFDVYDKPSDYTYTTYNTQVWINWTMDRHKLRKLGLFIEGEIPVIAWFANKINGVDVDIPVGSYFSIAVQFIPSTLDTNFFEVVDILIPSMHDAVVTRYFKIAPRRVK